MLLPLSGYTKRLAVTRKTAPLFDCGRFTRNSEAAYMTMWQRWKDGKLPEAFTVSEDDAY